MFTYFLAGEDSTHRLERLSSSVSASDGSDATTTTAAASVDAPPSPVKPGADPRGPSRRPPPLQRHDYGRSCDLTMDAIFPNFQRSLIASSKRRRLRHCSTIDSHSFACFELRSSCSLWNNWQQLSPSVAITASSLQLTPVAFVQ